MKTFLKFSVFVLAMVLFLACEKVTEISLNKNELYLAPGETETLIATVYPTDAYHKKANWTSSNPAVATVTDNGLVTAIESGETIITASSQNGNKTAICFITVDYRAKWVGVYECEGIYELWSTSTGTIYTDTFQTTVNVAIMEETKLKFLENKDEETYEAKVSVTGNFIGDVFYHGSVPKIRGSFSNDTLYMSIIHTSGLGAGSGVRYKGSKLKSK